MKKSYTSIILTEVVLGTIIILGVLLLLTNDFDLFLSILYSPFSFLLLVVIILEYIILKGMDRSRIYKLEIQRLKQKRKKDMEWLQRMDKEIREIHNSLGKSKTAENTKKRLEKVIKSFKEY